MRIICGSIPDESLPLSLDGLNGESKIIDDFIILPGGREIPIARGTAALAASALLTCQALGVPAPLLLLFGDTGQGAGSKKAYAWLERNLSGISEKSGPIESLAFHYFYPDADGHNRVLMEIQRLRPRPVLTADAGYMYAAKMSGYAAEYNLFTPDIGELAFLADEKAPHPYYTRGFLLTEEEDVPSLLKRAIEHGNCPENLIIKGAKDYIVCNGETQAVISEPSVPAMECIGGTGDIVSGLAQGFLAAGLSVCESASYAAKAARELALFCRPDPAAQAADLIRNIKPLLLAKKELFPLE